MNSEKHIFSFTEFIHENRLSIKRKYTEKYPEIKIGMNAPIREKILLFVKENKKVSHKQLMEFISMMNEESGTFTSRKWINKNTRYFHISEKNGIKTYTLSILGKKACNAISKESI
jgi:hypothetical protein